MKTGHLDTHNLAAFLCKHHYWSYGTWQLLSLLLGKVVTTVLGCYFEKVIYYLLLITATTMKSVTESN